MKAIVVSQFGAPEVLEYKEIPQPTVQKDSVLIRVKAAGVNPVDTYIRAGSFGYQNNLPFIPGIDGAGVVEEVGEEVTKCYKGQRVFFQGVMGSYAEYIVCPESHVFELPQHITFAQGAAIGSPYATAYHALFQLAAAQAGQSVLVHGASGGVGIAALQWAKSYGLNVLATAGSPKGREIIMNMGIKEVFNHNEEGYVEQILSYTKNQGLEIILEMLANKNLGKDLSLVARYGKIVIIGSRGSIEINPRNILRKEAKLIGVNLFLATADQRKSIFSAIEAGLKSGILLPIIRTEIPLEKASLAHELIMQPGAAGKIVLIM
ncbi:NADPH:quinone reductase [Methylacidiphilum caldifontis]|uniref:NADPH:quinone reductase n=1 Tax=Methylacidiphilum caldifontis TaxID=2795386 RepID=UPI001A8FE8C4|nr:NADPH:quinone reductase [Methylacidiphilum caldifontis]QSR88298.1 NADPH:quinone reductase [Methylacidiphilum caldifontis]